MIVIKNVELIETERDWFEYVTLENLYPWPINDINALATDAVMQRHIVKGRRFCRNNGQWVIGMTDEVAEILGLQYEAWDNMKAILTGT